MATNLLPTAPVMIRACSGPNLDSSRRKNNSSANWWSPLFGMSSEADYIDKQDGKKEGKSESDLVGKMEKSPRFTPGGFTEEKAKQLRMFTRETSSFHDIMYHSAIASRLASERRSDY